MDFTVSIVTAPNPGLSVAKEVELTKLGLLYADKVEISSASLYYVLAFVRMATLEGTERIDFVRGIFPSLPGITPSQVTQFEEAFKHLPFLKSKLNKTLNDILLIQKLEESIENLFSGLGNSAEKVFIESGAEAIIPYISNGQIVIKDLGSDVKQAPQLLIDGALDSLKDELTYPLFDDSVSDLINLYIKENSPEINYENTRTILAGKDLLLRLPNINGLTIEQVITLKGEMQIELIRFKSLINEYASDIEGIPFEQSMQVKLAKKYNIDFKPQLAELQSLINKNSFVKHLYSGFLDNIKEFSMLGIGAATLLEMKSAFINASGAANPLDIKNAVMGASGAALAQGFKALNEQRKQQDKIRENKLYFYHKLSEAK